MIAFRKLVLVWMIAWLPLSGAIAAVMPFSGTERMSTPSGISAMSAAIAPNHAAEHAGLASLPCHDGVAADTNLPGTCTQCVLCHLAVSLMLPSIPELPGLTPSQNFARTRFCPYVSFIPELVSPPPRSIVS